MIKLLIRQKVVKILLILSAYLILSSCKHPTPPVWAGEIYAGDSSQAAIVRAQSGQKIMCVDPAFDDYMCVSYSDFKKLVKIIDSCQVWEKDANIYLKKLDECGLLTDKNIRKVKSCISE